MRPLPFLATSLMLFWPSLHAEWATNPRADFLIGNCQTLENSIATASGIAVDEIHHKIYVSCESSNRVVRFDRDEVIDNGPLTQVEAVFGQPELFSDTPGLSDVAMYKPSALAVDAAGTLWVSDNYNRRILRFDQAHTKATGARANGVLGSPLFTTKTTELSVDVHGLAVDSFGNLFVSDGAHNCVYRYNAAASKANGAPPDVVLGQPDMSSTSHGTSAVKMHNPRGIFAAGNGSTTLWVVDQSNNRVLRFDNAHFAGTGAAAASVLGQPDMVTKSEGNAMSRFKAPLDVAVLGSHLYVSDPGNHRTLRFTGSFPAINSSATATMMMTTENVASGPERLAVEPFAGRLWGASSEVGVWFNSAGSGAGMIPRTGVFGFDEPSLSSPRDIAIDPISGKVFVAECGSTPMGVARYSNYASLLAGAEPEAWVCKRQSYSNLSTGGGLYTPYGLSIDLQGRLWVADFVTRAVYRYDNAATMGAYTAASAYLGGTSGDAANQMLGPVDVYADPQGRVWVVDCSNHRVLRFNNAAAKSNGAPADGVLGQGGFGESDIGSSPNSWNMNFPRGITGDGLGNIWVADAGNNRVLRFNNAAAKVNGGAANGVIGQLTTGTGGAGLGPDCLDHPAQLAWEVGGHLWVSEAGNNRVMRFKNALTLGNGAAASNVIGQPDFWHNDVRPDMNHTIDPCGMTVDPLGRLWVADIEGDRIMRFSPGQLAITSYGINPQNKFRLQYSSISGAQYDIESSPDLQSWSYEGTQVASGALTEWTATQVANGRRFYRVTPK